MNEKNAALCAVAKAYFDRGVYIQYDQRTLNRSGPSGSREERRIKGKEPEYATSQRTLHLDCSSFVYSVYYQTFGISLKADLTESMIELADIRTYYYKKTFRETPEEIAAVLEAFQKELQPGDAIVTRNTKEDNGHIMLYVGDGLIYHCTAFTALGGGDYDYKENLDHHEINGGICKMDLAALLNPEHEGKPSKRYFFSENISRFAILRPYTDKDELLPNAKARLKGLCDVAIEKTCSKHPGESVEAGEELTYFITAKNTGLTPKEVEIRDKAPKGTTLVGREPAWSFQLAPLEALTVSFKVRVDADASGVIKWDATVVNGTKVSYVENFVGKNLTEEECLKIVEAAKKTRTSGWQLARRIYKKALDVDLPWKDSDELMIRMIAPSKADTLVVIPDREGERAMLVPDMYGGKNMQTNKKFPLTRVRELRASQFQIGDVVMYASQKDLCCIVYIGNGRFATENGIIRGEETFKVLDSLLGQFMFFVLRPSFIL